MQKRLTPALIVAVLLFSLAYNAEASTYPARLGAKLGNGVANVATGFIEIPRTIRVANREDGPAYAATAGLMTGIVHMIGRTLCGAYDLATFVIPTRPIVNPDYVWQDWDKETTYRSTWQLLP